MMDHETPHDNLEDEAKGSFDEAIVPCRSYAYNCTVFMNSYSIHNYSSYNEYHSVPFRTRIQNLFDKLDLLKNEVDEQGKRRLGENMKNMRFNRAEKKTEGQFWLNIEELLSCYRKADDRHSNSNFSSILSNFRCGSGECTPNNFTEKEDNQRNITRNMSSHLDNNKLHSSYRNVSRFPDFEFQYDYTDEYSQHIRKKIVRRVSSSVVSTVVFLSILFNIWSQLSFIEVHPLQKEYDHRLSIWSSLLGLFGFMVFVCAVAVMILVGASFTSMQKAMLIFYVILMHLKSASSISEVFVPLAGGLFMGWHAFGKSNHQMK